MWMKWTIAIFIAATTTSVTGCVDEVTKADEAAQRVEPTEMPAVDVKDVPDIEEISDRAVEIKITEKGYQPDQVTVEAGVTTTLVFTRTSEDACGDAVVIPSQKIDKKIPLNDPTSVTITPEKAGELSFACGAGEHKGKIVAQ